MYCEDCATRGNSPNTIDVKRRCLAHFVTFCEDNDIENLNDVSGRTIFNFRQWRFDDSHAKTTIRNNLNHLRDFFRFVASIDGVMESLPEKIDPPSLEDDENVRHTYLDASTARDVLTHLSSYEYASFSHTLLLLMWETGCRISALHSLDVEDVDTSNHRVLFEHRPETDTRLKNGDNGTRYVNLPEKVIDIVADFIEVNRHGMTDEHGRTPLFPSKQGRMGKSQLAKRVCYYTTPCHIGKSCPKGRDPQDCEHASTLRASSGCPHSNRPHDLRRGSITMWLNEETPRWAVSERMDVSEDTLEKHYDARTDEERAEVRRDYFE